MREILFRGKTKYNNEWIYGSLVRLGKESFSDPDRYGITDKGIPVGNTNVCYNFQVDEVVPETVGQYTGLTDKNGKKIFEGDIIRFDENLYTVQRECDTPGGYWAETGYILKHIGWSDYTSFTSTIDDWENECQVFIIGNIHNNPELLK